MTIGLIGGPADISVKLLFQKVIMYMYIRPWQTYFIAKSFELETFLYWLPIRIVWERTEQMLPLIFNLSFPDIRLS